jgi:hypothetical protein
VKKINSKATKTKRAALLEITAKKLTKNNIFLQKLTKSCKKLTKNALKL